MISKVLTANETSLIRSQVRQNRGYKSEQKLTGSIIYLKKCHNFDQKNKVEHYDLDRGDCRNSMYTKTF